MNIVCLLLPIEQCGSQCYHIGTLKKEGANKMQYTLINQHGNLPVHINKGSCGFVRNSDYSITYYMSLDIEKFTVYQDFLKNWTGKDKISNMGITLNAIHEFGMWEFRLALTASVNGKQHSLVIPNCQLSIIEKSLVNYYIHKINQFYLGGKGTTESLGDIQTLS